VSSTIVSNCIFGLNVLGSPTAPFRTDKMAPRNVERVQENLW
jgi:hypothetical protein